MMFWLTRRRFFRIVLRFHRRETFVVFTVGRLDAPQDLVHREIQSGSIGAGLATRYDFSKHFDDIVASQFARLGVRETRSKSYFAVRRRSSARYSDATRRPLLLPQLSPPNQPNAIGNEAWAVGEWSCTLEGQNGPVQVILRGSEP
jgi:hypothetical protein